MFLKTQTGKSTKDFSSKLMRLKKELQEADAVIVGAGAGVSSAAGFQYDGERFYKHFHDFADRYGFTDMYAGGFYPYETLEEYWAYWSRYIFINRYQDAPKPVYEALFEIVKNKDYFVLTTNVDHCFQKAGFDKSRLFYTQGDYGLFQCRKPCHRNTYGNEKSIYGMIKEQKAMKIPSKLIPRCPKCGEPMTMNLRADSTFVEEWGWHKAARQYSDFLAGHKQKKVLFLELGTGYNTPGIIKYPFWQMTYQWPNAVYACINLDQAFAPDDIKTKSICLNEELGKILERLHMSRQ